MSSLRSRSTWFCTPFEWQPPPDKTGAQPAPLRITAAHIREQLGDFERVKRQPARYGARMAQAFTATDPSLTLQESQIEIINDVEKIYRGEKVCFTDGVGQISYDLMKKVWSALHNGLGPANVFPSAFQFRLGGYKGVLTVDSSLKGEKM